MGETVVAHAFRHDGKNRDRCQHHQPGDDLLRNLVTTVNHPLPVGHPRLVQILEASQCTADENSKKRNGKDVVRAEWLDKASRQKVMNKADQVNRVPLRLRQEARVGHFSTQIEVFAGLKHVGHRDADGGRDSGVDRNDAKKPSRGFPLDLRRHDGVENGKEEEGGGYCLDKINIELAYLAERLSADMLALAVEADKDANNDGADDERGRANCFAGNHVRSINKNPLEFIDSRGPFLPSQD